MRRSSQGDEARHTPEEAELGGDQEMDPGPENPLPKANVRDTQADFLALFNLHLAATTLVANVERTSQQLLATEEGRMAKAEAEAEEHRATLAIMCVYYALRNHHLSLHV